ncbi:hypothetical protein COCCADRAFT_35095 [Bipolaris zeicola 26-R-13]|uniref:Uncharacterized protein n=1 Tax=Cochliobolus carbonum (strain 26-R-13) TaxID=930089 RepID=W6YI91_COCC2|nr:uncharacterized protein COCCADRAFT_35095 [Bipolaris zeicola 26-R-13]EUC35364.1 hypothetical protein COCCADRAFT_35095 [Bipolaris zeicola 26-R-13]
MFHEPVLLLQISKDVVSGEGLSQSSSLYPQVAVGMWRSALAVEDASAPLLSSIVWRCLICPLEEFLPSGRCRSLCPMESHRHDLRTNSSDACRPDGPLILLGNSGLKPRSRSNGSSDARMRSFTTRQRCATSGSCDVVKSKKGHQRPGKKKGEPENESEDAPSTNVEIQHV